MITLQTNITGLSMNLNNFNISYGNLSLNTMVPISLQIEEYALFAAIDKYFEDPAAVSKFTNLIRHNWTQDQRNKLFEAMTCIPTDEAQLK